MSIDAIITNVKQEGKDLILELGPRIAADGSKSIAGQPRLRIQNFTWQPKIGQAIWGGADGCIIEPAGKVSERRHYKRTAAGYLKEGAVEYKPSKAPPPFVLELEDMEVASWSPGEPGEHKPCTQVHVLLKLAGIDEVLVMRYKSKAAVDQLIAALIEHRDFVWPEE